MDDNGNGLVDEGRLVRKNIDTAEEFAICEGLSLSDCSFVLDGSSVTITVTSSAYLEKSQDDHELTRAVTVNPRN